MCTDKCSIFLVPQSVAQDMYCGWANSLVIDVYLTPFFLRVCVFACLVVAKGTAISLSVCIHMMLLAEPSLRSVRTDRSEILERCFHIFARPGKTLQKANFSYRLVLLAYKHL